MFAEFPVSGFCCDGLILLILQSSVFWLSSQIWFWKSLSFTFPEKKISNLICFCYIQGSFNVGKHDTYNPTLFKITWCSPQKREWETCAEPDPAIPNATLGVILSISTPTVNKDVKQTLQFAFIVLLREKNPVNFFLTSEALFTIQTQSSL